MLGKAMRIVTLCTLAFAICGERVGKTSETVPSKTLTNRRLVAKSLLLGAAVHATSGFVVQPPHPASGLGRPAGVHALEAVKEKIEDEPHAPRDDPLVPGLRRGESRTSEDYQKILQENMAGNADGEKIEDEPLKENIEDEPLVPSKARIEDESLEEKIEDEPLVSGLRRGESKTWEDYLKIWEEKMPGNAERLAGKTEDEPLKEKIEDEPLVPSKERIEDEPLEENIEDEPLVSGLRRGESRTWKDYKKILKEKVAEDAERLAGKIEDEPLKEPLKEEIEDEPLVPSKERIEDEPLKEKIEDKPPVSGPRWGESKTWEDYLKVLEEKTARNAERLAGKIGDEPLQGWNLDTINEMRKFLDQKIAGKAKRIAGETKDALVAAERIEEVLVAAEVNHRLEGPDSPWEEWKPHWDIYLQDLDEKKLEELWLGVMVEHAKSDVVEGKRLLANMDDETSFLSSEAEWKALEDDVRAFQKWQEYVRERYATIYHKSTIYHKFTTLAGVRALETLKGAMNAPLSNMHQAQRLAKAGKISDILEAADSGQNFIVDDIPWQDYVKLEEHLQSMKGKPLENLFQSMRLSGNFGQKVTESMIGESE